MTVAAIAMEDDNITVDFNGAVVEGNADINNPDNFTGTGIIIKSGRDISILLQWR